MKVYIAANPTEAHIICELLKHHDIEAEVRGDSLFGLKGELPFTQESDPFIWLYDLDKLQQAKDVIAEFEQRALVLPRWQCDSCGESNEGQFSICWNCSSVK